MTSARADEDIRVGRDTTGHAAVVAGAELNRKLQAQGWRIADPVVGNRHHWSHDT